jgi:hypothetical protein
MQKNVIPVIFYLAHLYKTSGIKMWFPSVASRPACATSHFTVSQIHCKDFNHAKQQRNSILQLHEKLHDKFKKFLCYELALSLKKYTFLKCG